MVQFLGSFLFAVSLWTLFGTAALATAPGAIDGARDDYRKARKSISQGRWREYDQLRAGLDDYPLAIYLDYYKLSKHPQRIAPEQAQTFISASEDTPLPNRLLVAYLSRAGKDRRWQDFLQLMPEEPNSIDLKCYFFRATLASGDSLAAWEGAERLWVHGKSRPKECDPLFAAWLKADQLDDAAVWARLLATFDERQRSLMIYVARKGSADLQPWSDKLQAIYRHPEKLAKQTLPAGNPYSADIASHGLVYLARYSPEKALALWTDFRDRLSFSEQQINNVEQAIALRSLFKKVEPNIAWLDTALARLKDDKLVEIRLRWALEEQDWSAVEKNLPLLSAERGEDASWRYWQAAALEQRGEKDQARAILEEIATERGYYSFLAADKLGQAYEFNSKPTVAVPAGLDSLPVVARIEELFFHREVHLAHSEWYKAVQDVDPAQREALATLAADQGWHRMSIDAANQAKAWDRLDLRFPMPFQETFSQYAALRKVDSTELMAIARRESAFHPQAQSPVGARGLMQLMPATGKQVASSLGASHRKADLYEVEHNVQLGSAYYRQLLNRFDDNRVFALTAYNAGPHRVNRWRNKAGERLPVDIWIATIPYKETRNYVQAVLSYNVVFQHLLGQDRSLLSMQEFEAGY